MAKKGGGGGGGTTNVGAIGVEIILEGESLAQQIAEQTQGVEGSTQTAGSTRARDVASGKTKDASPTVTNVDAKVKTKIEGKVSNDVQAAIDAQEYGITLDTDSIRHQVELALKRAFDITVRVKVEGASAEALANLGTTHGAAVTAGASLGRGAPPAEVFKGLTQHAKDAINSVYDNLNRVLEESGKGQFGRHSVQPGNEAEKALELMGAFGNKVKDWIDLDFSDVLPQVQGGNLTAASLVSGQGVDPNAPSLPSLDAALRGLFSENGRTTSTQSFFNRLQRWSEETPETIQTPPEQVIQHTIQATKKEEVGPTAAEQLRAARETQPADAGEAPATTQLADALKVLKTARSNIPFESLDPARIAERYGPKPEAEAPSVVDMLTDIAWAKPLEEGQLPGQRPPSARELRRRERRGEVQPEPEEETAAGTEALHSVIANLRAEPEPAGDPMAEFQALRQKYVDAIAQLQETGHYADPDTGETRMGFVRDPALRDLRRRMNALQPPDLSPQSPPAPGPVTNRAVLAHDVPTSQLAATIADAVSKGFVEADIVTTETTPARPAAGPAGPEVGAPTREQMAARRAAEKDDAESTARANQQLGNDRANVRRLIGGFVPRMINGIMVDINDELEALRGGEFAGAFKTKEGELKRFTPQTPEQELQAAEAAKSRRGFKVEGVGMVQPVGPTEAFRLAVAQKYDEEIANALLEDQAVKNLVSQSARQGGAARPLVSPQGPPDAGREPSEPSRGANPEIPIPVVGAPGIAKRAAVPGETTTPRESLAQGSGESQIISSSGHGFEGGYRAALRLLDVQEDIKSVVGDIDNIWAKIEDRTEKGGDTSKLEATLEKRNARLDTLRARERDLTEKALPLVRTPEQARAAEAAGRISGAENRQRIARGEGRTPEEEARAALSNPTLLGQRGREMIARGVLPKPENVLEDVTQRAEALKGEGATQAGAFGQAIREVFGELEEMLPEKGPEKKEAQFQLSALRRALFGEKERVEAPEGAQSSLATERRGGLIPTMEKDVQQEADRAESGRGGGRRAQVIGTERTGASTASGVSETRPVVARPTTSLDIERQQLRDEYEALAGAFAFEENQRQERNIKRRTGPGKLSEAQPVEDIMLSPPVKNTRTGKTVPAGITKPIRERVETETDVGARTREIRETQAAADALLEQIGQGTEPVIGPRENFPSLMEEQRARVERLAPNEAVKKEALEVLETRTASMARSPETTAGRDPLTGDALSERARTTRSRYIADEGDIAPGEGVFAAYNRRGGGNGNQPPAPPGGPTGPSGQRPEVTGQIHVIVDNTPLPVTFSGAQPGAAPGIGGGTVAQQAATNARQNAAINRAELRRAMTDQNTRFVEDFIAKQRDAGKSDTAIKAALNKAKFGVQAELALDTGGEGGRGGTSVGGLNQLRGQLGLSPSGVSEEAFGDVQQQDIFRSEVAAQARAMERQLPKRGFGPSLTDMLTNIGGFLDSSVEAIDVFRREGAQFATLRAKGVALTQQRDILQETSDVGGQRLSDLGTRRDAARAGGNRNEARSLGREFQSLEKDLGKVRRKLQDVTVALGENEEAQGLQEKVFEGAKKALPGVPTRAAGFAIGGLAAAGAVGIGIGVAQLGQQMAEVVVEAFKPVAERLSGFGATVGRIQSDMASNIRGQNDQTQVVLATMGTAARLTDRQLAMIEGPLGQRGETVSRGRALGEQFELFNVAQAVERQRLPGGFDRGLSRPTGGQFDVQLPFKLFGVQNVSVGGEPSISERLVGQLRALPGAGERESARAAIEQERGEETGQPVPIPLEEALTPEDEGAARVKEFDDRLGEFNEGLDFLNESLKDSGFKLVEDTTAAGKVLLDNQHRLFELGGEGDLGGMLREQQIRVEGIDPTKGPQQQVLSLLDALTKGAKLSPRQLLEQSEPQRRAQVQTQFFQREFRLNQIIPQTTALAGIQRPFTDASAGIEFSSQDRPETRRQLNADLKVTQGLYNGINKEIDAGVEAAIDFVTHGADIKGLGDDIGGLGVDAGKQFADSLKIVRDTGRQIAAIEIGLQTKQAAYQAAQFSYQIGIAKRSLADAKGLAGQLTDAGKENLGVLEREQFFLQRRAQAMQLEMSQKQINFQRAIAGFTAPGLTGEERAARIEQAKLEAKYAQDQLNIQKQLFGLQGQQFDITSSRQVKDLTQQLDLLERGRVITLETAAAEKRIKALTHIQERENKIVEALYEAAIESTNDIIQTTGELAAAVGKDMGELAQDVINAYVKVYKGIISAANDTVTQGGFNPDQKEPKYGGGAAGGNVMRNVPKIVGEQGPELFTPGENGLITPFSYLGGVTPAAGSGSMNTTNITIMVTGNKISSEEELKKLEARITDAVNRAQSRQISLLGGRTY